MKSFLRRVLIFAKQFHRSEDEFLLQMIIRTDLIPVNEINIISSFRDVIYHYIIAMYVLGTYQPS